MDVHYSVARTHLFGIWEDAGQMDTLWAIHFFSSPAQQLSWGNHVFLLLLSLQLMEFTKIYSKCVKYTVGRMRICESV